MIQHKNILLLFLLGLVYFNSYSQVKNLGKADFEDWKNDRIEEVTSENGWLNLSGLFWLNNELKFLNTLNQELILETQSRNENLGYFEWNADSVWFIPNSRTREKFNLPSKILQFPEESYGSNALKIPPWKWSIIERDESFGVRTRNLNHPSISKFNGIPAYGYQENWSIEAQFIPKFNESILIKNVVGQEYEVNVMGHILFQYEGQDHELLAFEEEGKLWVIFSDLTNEKETYPSGRYMYVGFPDRTGKLNLDFNYAYNPPCAFTKFATCPIPPKENRLDFAIPAGEKWPKDLGY
ncbi:DUF1684 domain-containing protein [Algoriphagus machipongonensis]|uniref:DUF1684 domain-containing protein n=1 Tax=Algoriphagus machipongonensis TaxID=388413 RepID=A3HSY6_9BACT|nr:DUF1684 domain-containing protein [Algoriphagus machipongonensis]EAZ82954.1 hypothetical protein ALPR1_12075 [Algoriphagus machipongonensis]